MSEKCVYLVTVFGLYLTGEGQNVLEIVRFVRFRKRRCGLKKISPKNIIFEESYSILKKLEIFFENF